MRLFFLIFLVFFYGCQVGPKYQKPKTCIPSQWKTTSSEDTKSVAIENWWEVFEDTQLNTLEEQVVKCNYDLYMALQKVAEARAIAGVSKSNLYPQLSFNFKYGYTQDYLKIKQLSQPKVPGLKDKITVYGQDYAFPNLFTYELDLWGKYRSRYHSAILHAEVAKEDMRASLLSLTTTLASNYFNLRSLDVQLDVIENILSCLQESLDLYIKRYEKGLSSDLDVLAAEKKLADKESEYQELNRQRALFENAIASLISIPAPQFAIARQNSLFIIPKIPTYLPSAVMKQRPDIAAAELSMKAKHALIKTAYASFFPDFSLTGGVDYEHLTLKDFLNIKSFLWQVGASVAESIYDAGRKKSQLLAAWAKFKEAEGSYQKTVLNAFEDVENSLSNLEQQAKKEVSLSRAFRAAEKRASLSEIRWKKGVVSKLEVLSYKTSSLESEQKVIHTKTLEIQATLDLIKSLGGSWACL